MPIKASAAEHARPILPAATGNAARLPPIATARLFAAPPQGITERTYIHLIIQTMAVITRNSASIRRRNESVIVHIGAHATGDHADNGARLDYDVAYKIEQLAVVNILEASSTKPPPAKAGGSKNQ